MKSKKLRPVLRGTVTTTASLLSLVTVGYSVAKSPLAVGWMDGWFNAERTIYKDWEEEVPGYTIPGKFEGYSYLKGKQFTKSDNTIQEYAQRLKNHAIKQGEEGFALLKNDNNALPLKSSQQGKKVALFGWNAYNLPSGHTGVVAGNITGDVKNAWGGGSTHYEAYLEQTSLYQAFKDMEGVTVNDTVKADQFKGAMTGPSNGGGFGGKQNPWSDISYKIPELAPEDSDIATWDIDKDNTTGIVVLGRGGGEGNNYKVDAATNADGSNAEDPLALSKDELEIVKLAKQKCSKVVALIVSANAMELGPLVQKGGDYEVDAIGFCGVPNDWQYIGIANALYGKVNASGGLTDTYVYDNSYTPASINMGEQFYSDLDTITNFNDPLGRGVENVGLNGYFADHYIVEAEGIYVGYKYYETRYYDAMVNPDTTKAKSTKGSSKNEAWDYNDEVIYTFGHGLSYIPYTQTIKEINVDLSEKGQTTATIEVKNEGTEAGDLLAQLYVSKPFTSYDKEHKVEKSAVDFLNSKKVYVKAGETKEVKITLPTRYLASWDSSAKNGNGAWIMDDGDYYFTTASGAHEAVNNVLKKQGHTTDGTTTEGEVATWNLETFNDSAFAKSNGVDVKNQMQNADINYYLGDDYVKYLSRTDWDGTFPKNYTSYTNKSGIASEPQFTIKGSPKETEWLTELISAQYKITPSSNESDWVSNDGVMPDGLNGKTVWQWILQLAQDDPEAFSNINSEQWQAVAKAINLDEAVASQFQSGNTSRSFSTIGNPISRQSESVAGYQQTIKCEATEGDGKTLKLNVCSNTLLGASFNPELAYEWGVIEGEGGLWLQEINNDPAITVWGAGLTQHRHAYNGRNSEYISEDPMLSNRIGEQQMIGAVSKGAICGPKHMGFNDQERGREGVACYMTEQKVRETDTRCFEGALRVDEGNGTGVMMSFARIGATNTTNSIGYMKNIIRGEFGFTGIITTDMGKGKGYHEIGALTMATVNEYAGFKAGSVYGMDSKDDDATFDESFSYITLGNARKDPKYAAQARQTALYLIFTIARTGSGIYVERVANNGEDIVVPATTIKHHDPDGTVAVVGWEKVFIGFEIGFAVLTAAAAIGYIAVLFLGKKEENN